MNKFQILESLLQCPNTQCLTQYIKGFCLINYSTVQIINIFNFRLQLMHYVRSEHTLSDSPIPIQADYALNGQFVSNWEDQYTKRFLKPQVEFIAPLFVRSFNIIQYTANYFVQNLLLFVLYKLIRHYRSKFKQNSTTPSSAISLYIGFCICLILFGIPMFVTELSNNPPLVQGRLISIFVSLGSYTFFLFCI